MAQLAQAQVRRPPAGAFWQIVRPVAPPWNTRYGSCALPETDLSVFFGGSAGGTDAWLCDSGAVGATAAPFWTLLGATGAAVPAPRLYPLMAGLTPTTFVVLSGTALAEPWPTFTDAFVGKIHPEAGSVSWTRVVNSEAAPGGAPPFSYASASHAPTATLGAFMRSEEGVLVAVMPVSAPPPPGVGAHDTALPPSAQNRALVVTAFDADAHIAAGGAGAVSARYELARAPLGAAGGWPVTDLQSVRLAPLVDGFAVGCVVPLSSQTHTAVSASTWLLRLSCAPAAARQSEPAIAYSWRNLGASPSAPALRSGMALFHSRAQTPASAVVAVYGGSAIWRTSSASDSAPLPLHVGLFSLSSDRASFSFVWQNAYARANPPLASDPPSWDGQVAPAEARAFAQTFADAVTLGFVHYGGFWRSPESNATTITVLTVPRAALESVPHAAAAVRIDAQGVSYVVPNVAKFK